MGVVAQILPAWVRPYVGLPYRLFGRDRSGLDCWGLVALASREQFGRDLPAHGVAYARDERDLASMAAYIRDSKEGFVRVEPPAAGDVVLLKIFRLPCHVGLMVNQTWFLHVHEGINTVVEPIDGARWKRERHVEGFYRWEGDHAGTGQ